MRIRWTKPAANDLTHIADYTKEHFGSSQAHVAVLAIYEAAKSLEAHPHRGRPGRKAKNREMVVPGLPFVMAYRIRGDTIEIIRILHGAQRWP